MKRLEAILAVAMAISLAGCILRGTPKAAATPPAAPQPVVAAAPPPPPQPLSIPQTQVELPPAQPVTPEALATAQPVETPAETPVAPKPPRRPNPVPQTKPEPPAAAPPPQPAEERPPIQEQLDPTELKRLQDAAGSAKQQIRQLLAQARRRRFTADEVNLEKRILEFVKLADEAEKGGDMRAADDLAEKALVLAKGLQGGR